MYLMREDVIFIYPYAPINLSKYMKVQESYNSFDYMIVRETDKAKHGYQIKCVNQFFEDDLENEMPTTETEDEGKENGENGDGDKS